MSSTARRARAATKAIEARPYASATFSFLVVTHWAFARTRCARSTAAVAAMGWAPMVEGDLEAEEKAAMGWAEEVLVVAEKCGQKGSTREGRRWGGGDKGVRDTQG